MKVVASIITPVYFDNYTPHGKIFEMKVVEANEIYMLRHFYQFLIR
jgi:hypothetical protein